MSKIVKILPLVLFSAFSIKMIIYVPSIADGVVLAILASLIGFLEYKSSDKQYKLLEERLNNADRQHADLTLHLNELKSFVQTMNLQNKLSPMNRSRTGQI